MATVSIGGDTFEAGASILHPKNYHALNFTTNYLNQTPSTSTDEDETSFAIWDGDKFVFKTLTTSSQFPIVNKLVSFVNSMRIFFRYGFSLFRMNNFIEDTVNKFMKYYQGIESRPVFGSVEEMLKWAGLFNLTTRPLEQELLDAGLSPLLIQELVTVITRINYGQSVLISGLAGAVSLAGSGGGLWAVKGGNWQMAAALINNSDVLLHLNEEIESISYLGHYYELNTTEGKSYGCEVTVVATPLDELDIQFHPEISIPKRKLQHTYTTFIRGLLNHSYFGLDSVADIPDLVGTIEVPIVPFTCISVLKKYNADDMTYKMFSRKPMTEELLDKIFSVRNETIKINWAAYPQFHAPETFAPFILDDQHLYYVNAFENAASTMETSAVSAENIARLIMSRLATKKGYVDSSNLRSFSYDVPEMHVDL